MSRRPAILLAALGLLAPAALISSAAGAIDQDLVVSATAGPPGTVVTVSSASCESTDSIDAYLSVSLITGTAPNEQLAGIGQGFEGSAIVTIPDWVDPAQPAVIEATCEIWNDDLEDSEMLDYDPVAFDIEPGAGAPTQVRTLSRTELLAGQGLLVNGSCGTYQSGFAVSTVLEGADQSGRDVSGFVGEGVGEPESDGSFENATVVTNAGAYYGVSSSNGEVTEVEVIEEPMDVPPGDYTVFTYCVGDDDSLLFLQPAALTVTGTAPTDLVELAGGNDTRDVVMAGECDTTVEGYLDGISTDDLVEEWGIDADPVARSLRWTGGAAERDGRIGVRAGQRLTPNGIERIIDSGDGVGFTDTADDDGVWRYSDVAGFDWGVITGQATCGDPFADGFVYDPQGLVVDVAEVPTTTVPVTVPPTVPVPVPAAAVPGTPTYAG